MNTSTCENSHDHKPKTVSYPRKQNKKISQNNKKFIEEIITGAGFRLEIT